MPPIRRGAPRRALRSCAIAVIAVIAVIAPPAFAQDSPPAAATALPPGFQAEVAGTPGEPPGDKAEPPAPEPRSFHLDVGVATDFPISMGGYVGAELPGRILLQVGAGVMPGAYTSAVNGVLTGVGAYDATIGNFIQSAITSSFVLRLSGGWRPFRDHGLEILGGYTLMTLGGSAAEGDIINAVLTEAGSSQRVTAGSGATIPLSATLHNVHATLGWRWLLASDHLVIRASISYLQCLAANLGVTLPQTSTTMQTTVNQDLNNLVAPYFTSYIKTPLIGLSAAYRF